VATLGRKKLFWDENTQLAWQDEIPQNIGKIVAEQRRLDTETQTIEELPSSTTSPISQARQSTSQVEPWTPRQKRNTTIVSYEGMEGPTPSKSSKRTRTQTGKSGATKKEETIAELAGVLRELKVVTEEKLADRQDSGSERTSPTPIRNPIPSPNTTEQALWRLTMSKVEGIAKQRPVSVASEVMDAINTVAPETILQTMTALAAGLAKSGLNDTNAAAYIQSSIDTGNLFLRAGTERSQTMDQIRVLAGHWRNAFHRSILDLAPGRNPRDGRVQLSLDDFETLLQEPGRDGWLNAEVIEAGLRLHANTMAQRPYIMPAYAWTHWYYNNTNLPTLPQTGDVYIPVHMGGEHWGLAYLDITQHRIVWLDSLEGLYVGRQQAIEMLRRFINQHSHLNDNIVWEDTPIHSIQQTNSFDCGIFVIENGLALMNGETRAENINALASRRRLAETFWHNAMANNQILHSATPFGGTQRSKRGIDLREATGSPASSISAESVSSEKLKGLVDENQAWLEESIKRSQIRSTPPAEMRLGSGRSASSPLILSSPQTPLREASQNPETPTPGERGRQRGRQGRK